MEPLTREELFKVFKQKNGRTENLGWGPKLRLKFGYFTPDDWYEGIVAKLVTSEVRWLDVGSGRSLFPNNLGLEKELANRCKVLVGCDPDPTILENVAVHKKIQSSITDFKYNHQFDLVTMRMVAEHLVDPGQALKTLSAVTAPRGRVVVFTIFRWSPVPILTSLIPFSLHHPIKKFFWGTEERDTFPTAYKMNTRKELKDLFESSGLREVSFSFLDDCRTLARFRMGLYFEIFLWKFLRLLGLHYPEVCILGIYEKIEK